MSIARKHIKYSWPFQKQPKTRGLKISTDFLRLLGFPFGNASAGTCWLCFSVATFIHSHEGAQLTVIWAWLDWQVLELMEWPLWNAILWCAAFVHAAFVKLCKDGILYLSKTPEGLIKELIGQEQSQEKG